MKIGDIEIPPDIVEEYEATIRNASEDDILWYAKANPGALKGFRATKSAVGRIRDLLLKQLGQNGQMSQMLNLFLRSSDTVSESIAMLSETAIEFVGEEYMQLVGRSRFLAAALLDDRENVRDGAVAGLKKRPSKPLPDNRVTAKCTELVSMAVDPLLEELRLRDLERLEDEGEEKHEEEFGRGKLPEIDWDLTAKLEEKIRRLEEDLKENKAGRQREKVLQKKLDATNKKLQKAQNDVQSRQHAITAEKKIREELKQELTTLRQEHDELVAEMDGDVEARVEQGLRSTLNAWLIKPVEAAGKAARIRDAPGPDDLLEAAERALAKQAEMDRHSGNLREIRGQIERLNAALVEVRGARADALHPSSELAAVETRLEHEIQRLESAEGRDASEASSFAQRLLARINAAATIEELQAFHRLLEDMETLQAVEARDLVALYAVYNRRMSIFYGSFSPKVVKAAPVDDPVWRLKQASSAHEQLVLFIDGHNLLHLLPNIFSDAYEDGQPKAEARKQLVELTVKINEGHPECDTRVYFDGPKRSKFKHPNNVREIYSGGEGEHRADRVIVEDLEYCCRSMSAMPRLIVTNDKELRAEALRCGAKFMPVQQFAAVLDEVR